MSVMVYSRLGDLLRTRGLSVDDLQRQVAMRFGAAVDGRALARLAHGTRLKRPDIEAIGAAAAVLDVEIGDLFDVKADPNPHEGRGGDGHGVPSIDRDDATVDVGGDILAPEQGRRLRELYAAQHRRALSEDEWREMGALVAAYNEGLYERELEDLARARALPVEQVRVELAAERDRLLAARQELAADPARRAELVEAAWRRQRERATG